MIVRTWLKPPHPQSTFAPEYPSSFCRCCWSCLQVDLMALLKTAVFIASRFQEFADLREHLKRNITDYPVVEFTPIDLNDGSVSHRPPLRSEEHTSELQSRPHLVCRLLLEKKKKKK